MEDGTSSNNENWALMSFTARMTETEILKIVIKLLIIIL